MSEADEKAKREAQMNNMLGLVKFCLEATAKEDASGDDSSNIGSMDSDRRAWLEEAISSMTYDAASQLLDHLANIKKTIVALKEDPSKVTANGELEAVAWNSLRMLTNLCEQLDYAVDFAKLDGFSIFEPLLGCSHLRVTVEACRLIAALAQNNPVCQDMSVKTGLLGQLIDYVRTKENEIEARSYAMYAISSIVRSNEDVRKHFENNLGGLSMLLLIFEDQTLIQLSEELKGIKTAPGNERLKKNCSSWERFMIRSLFLFKNLCSESPDTLEYFYEKKVIIPISIQLDGLQSLEVVEHLLFATLTFLTSLASPKRVTSIESVPNFEGSIKRILSASSEQSTLDYDSTEIVGACQELQSLINSLK